MKKPLQLVCTLWNLAAWSETFYVSPDGANIPPYSSWTNAATSISSAVAQASNGDVVLVSDGVYLLTQQIELTNAICLQSLRGPAVTVIDGQQLTRCLYLENSNATASGFTIQNGFVSNPIVGGGVYIMAGGTISNCVITKNVAAAAGGVYAGSLTYNDGETEFHINDALIVNCIITSNTAANGYGGGGVYLEYGGEVRNSILSTNIAWAGGAGGGGGVLCWGGGTVRGCLIFENTHRSGEAYGGGGICVMQHLQSAQGVLIENCTIVRNHATSWNDNDYTADPGRGGGLYNWDRAHVVNCIIYSNTADKSGSPKGPNNYEHEGDDSEFHFSCTTPLPPVGSNNITNDPLLEPVFPYRLTGVSPCIDAGTNLIGATEKTDLGSQPRVFNGIIDIGADEAVVQAASTQISNDVTVIWESLPYATYEFQNAIRLDAGWSHFLGPFTGSTYQSTLTLSNAFDSIGFFRLIWLK